MEPTKLEPSQNLQLFLQNFLERLLQDFSMFFNEAHRQCVVDRKRVYSLEHLNRYIYNPWYSQSELIQKTLNFFHIRQNIFVLDLHFSVQLC